MNATKSEITQPMMDYLIEQLYNQSERTQSMSDNILNSLKRIDYDDEKKETSGEKELAKEPNTIIQKLQFHLRWTKKNNSVLEECVERLNKLI